MREMLFNMEWTVSRDAVIENECLFLVQRISITDQRLSKVQLPAYPISAALLLQEEAGSLSLVLVLVLLAWFLIIWDGGHKAKA